MQSINFNSGFKEYAINGDESKTIKVNVSDMNLPKRIAEVEKIFTDLSDKYKDENRNLTADELYDIDKTVREKINYAFGSDICTNAFGDTNCLSFVSNGDMLFEAFFNAFLPVIKAGMEKVAQTSKIKLEEKTAKYTAHLEKPVITTNNPVNVYANPQPVLPDVSNLTPEQKKALAEELSK